MDKHTYTQTYRQPKSDKHTWVYTGVDKSTTSLLAGVKAECVHLCRVAVN